MKCMGDARRVIYGSTRMASTTIVMTASIVKVTTSQSGRNARFTIVPFRHLSGG